VKSALAMFKALKNPNHAQQENHTQLNQQRNKKKKVKEIKRISDNTDSTRQTGPSTTFQT